MKYRGTVLSVYLDQKHDEEGDAIFKPRVEFQYSVNGQIYTSKTLSYQPLSGYGYKAVFTHIDDISKGKDVDIYVNSANHRQAVIIPGVNNRNHLEFIISILAAAFLIYALTLHLTF